MMPSPKDMVYFCFFLWLAGTILVFAVQIIWPPKNGMYKIPWTHPRFVMVRVVFYIWLSMWGFRLMY